MKKSHYFIIGGVLALLILGICVYTAFASPTVKAQLIVQSGTVQVDSGKGYMPVTDVVRLKESDKVRTLDGEASVILHESVVVDLEPHTELVIDDLDTNGLKLSQPEGDTWTKFAHITGVKTVEISTPDTVATVRGTFFGLNKDRILLGNGQVDYRVKGQMTPMQGMMKTMNQNGKGVGATVTAEERALLEAHREKMILRLKRLRSMEIHKHNFAVSMIKKRYGWTDDMMMQKVEELDDNNADLNLLEQQAPIRLSATKKIIKLTEEIRKMKNTPLPPVSASAAPPQQNQGASATASCPGNTGCCCQYGWPDCNEGYECRGWNIPGKQSFGSCVKKGTNPGAPLQLDSSQPAFCGK